jgi:hypothetical protein
LSKYAPAIGDTGVVGILTVLGRALNGAGFFDASVTANGYDSVAQNIYDPNLRFCCPFVREGLNNGDAVTADILESESGIAYAFNLEKL